MTEQKREAGLPVVKPLCAHRFKLSFNKVGNCTTLKNFAEELDGKWVWLIDATDGMNDPLYAPPTGEIIRGEEAEDGYHRRGIKIIEMTEIAGAHLCRAEKAEAQCADLAKALEPFEVIATAILAEAPSEASFFILFQDCEGTAHRITLDQLRSVSSVLACYRKESR